MKRNNLVGGDYHLPYNPKLNERARHLRANQTAAERKLWFMFLRHLKIRVLKQKPLDQFIVDFYIPQWNLVIEVDGDIHDTPDHTEYDENRSVVLAGYGLTIVRVSNEDVLNNFESVCSRIQSYMV